MEGNDKHKYYFTDFEELKEAEKLYAKCLEARAEDYKYIQIPSLKYALHSLLLLTTFKNRINKIMNDFKGIKRKLIDIQGLKLDAKKEIEKIDESIFNLLSIIKEANERYLFYRHYLTDLAKKSDVLNNETMKNIHIKASEEIIQSLINYYMKYEKHFLIFNDNINKLKNILNI